MPANNDPIYTLTPNIGRVKIPTATAQVKSDGTSAGSGSDLVYKAFTAGANGSYVDRVKFMATGAAAAVSSVATTLRVYLSTVASPGATAATDTWLIGECSIPTISAAVSHSTNAVSPYEVPVGFAIPTGTYIHVSQHVAQGTNMSWNAVVIGGDY